MRRLICDPVLWPLALAAALPLQAAQLTLAWDPVSAAAGYNLYYGETITNYTNTVAVGNATTHTLTGLQEGLEYCMVVTAYDQTRTNESGYSNEVCATAPTSGNAPAASFSASPSSGIAPLTVSFTDASSGNITGDAGTSLPKT